MLTLEAARELVEKQLSEHIPKTPCLIQDDKTIEQPFGWVFSYTSKAFAETGNIRFALAGNGPVMVNKHDGRVEFCGPLPPVDEQIEQYRQKWAE